jgi:hypothetical protein
MFWRIFGRRNYIAFIKLHNKDGRFDEYINVLNSSKANIIKYRESHLELMGELNFLIELVDSKFINGWKYHRNLVQGGRDSLFTMFLRFLGLR